MYHDAYRTTKNPIPVINKPKIALSPSMRKAKSMPGSNEKSDGRSLIVWVPISPSEIRTKIKIVKGAKERTHPNRCLKMG